MNHGHTRTPRRLTLTLACMAGLAAAPFAPALADPGQQPLRDVLELQLDIAEQLGNVDALRTSQRALERLDSTGGAELANIDEVNAAAARLAPVLEIFQASLALEPVTTPPVDGGPGNAGIRSKVPGAGLDAIAVSSSLSTPLTQANYFVDAACPYGERNDALTVFISEQALFVAEEVREVASRGCDQVVVALGAGGNTSLACLISDAVYITAKQVNNVLSFCDATVDAAETEAAFERTANIYDNLNEHHQGLSQHDANLAEHDGKLDAHDGKLDAHDAHLAAHDDNLATHDEEIKALIDDLQGRIDENTRRLGEVIALLHTPQGRRTSTTPVCHGGPCRWNF